jgi:acyl homoserine lactone synthase
MAGNLMGLNYLGSAQDQNLASAVIQIPHVTFPLGEEDRVSHHLFREFLALRKRVFTVKKNWDVWLKKRNDIDQYDQYDAHYIVVYNPTTLTVVAGARLLRTDRGACDPAVGGGTYMIKDAVEGRLRSLPSDLLFDAPPVESDVWELTRLVSEGPRAAVGLVMKELNRFLIFQGARSCLFLGPKVIARLARSEGFSPAPIGPLSGNGDGAFQVFRCDVIYPLMSVGTSVKHNTI